MTAADPDGSPVKSIFVATFETVTDTAVASSGTLDKVNLTPLTIYPILIYALTDVEAMLTFALPICSAVVLCDGISITDAVFSTSAIVTPSVPARATRRYEPGSSFSDRLLLAD